jgi:hypothetical protein
LFLGYGWWGEKKEGGVTKLFLVSFFMPDLAVTGSYAPDSLLGHTPCYGAVIGMRAVIGGQQVQEFEDVLLKAVFEFLMGVIDGPDAGSAFPFAEHEAVAGFFVLEGDPPDAFVAFRAFRDYLGFEEAQESVEEEG